MLVLFFDDMINVKNLDPDKIKVYEKSYKNILIYHINYGTVNSVKPLYLIIKKKMGTLKKVIEINIWH